MTDVLHLVLSVELFGVASAFLFGAGYGILWSLWRWLFDTKSKFFEALADFAFCLLVGFGILLHALSYMQGVLRLSSILAGAVGFSTCRWIFSKKPFHFRKK